MSINKASSNNRKKYDDGFKKDMVRKMAESGKSVSEFAAIMNINRINLQKWKQKYGPSIEDMNRKGKPELLRTEVERISHDLSNLHETVNQLRNIVKRTLAAKYRDAEL